MCFKEERAYSHKVLGATCASTWTPRAITFRIYRDFVAVITDVVKAQHKRFGSTKALLIASKFAAFHWR